jgi:hypothetical protein
MSFLLANIICLKSENFHMYYNQCDIISFVLDLDQAEQYFVLLSWSMVTDQS